MIKTTTTIAQKITALSDTRVVVVMVIVFAIIISFLLSFYHDMNDLFKSTQIDLVMKFWWSVIYNIGDVFECF